MASAPKLNLIRPNDPPSRAGTRRTNCLPPNHDLGQGILPGLHSADARRSLARIVHRHEPLSCSFSVPAEAISPDGLWKAEVREQSCGRPGDMHIISFVHLAALHAAGVRDYQTLIGFDTGGDPEKRPRIDWVNAKALQVSTPNLRFFVVRDGN